MGGQSQHDLLLGGEVQRRQFEVAASDPIADLVVEEAVLGAGLDRDPHLAQLVLVAFEGTLKSPIGQSSVALHQAADPLPRQVAAGTEQADQQVQLPFRFALRHLVLPCR